MQSIPSAAGKALIKHAQMLCSPEYGYALCFEKTNPFSRVDVSFEEGTEFFFSRHAHGDLIQIKQNNKISMMAFVLFGDAKS